MRVAVYGGSFNPPHVGHALVAAWVLWTDQADEVWLLPTASHPFAKTLVPFSERVALCQAVAAPVPGVQVCEIEGALPTPSYTIDTLTELGRRHPGDTFRLVVGADVMPQVDQWKDWAGIEDRFPPIVVGRQGYPTPAGAVDFPGVSSTEIRRRLGAGEPVTHLVPAVILAACRRLWPVGAVPGA